MPALDFWNRRACPNGVARNARLLLGLRLSGQPGKGANGAPLEYRSGLTQNAGRGRFRVQVLPTTGAVGTR
jgi:hypothetical protein